MSNHNRPRRASIRFQLLAILGTLFAVTVTFFMTVGHQYLSPGQLSALGSGQELGGYTSHAEFEQECSHCHAPIHCITDNKCQSCHMEIAEDRLAATGLHGLLPGTDRCQDCHQEHQGLVADITNLTLANVNHTRLAGFSLAQHQTNYDGLPLGCGDCHENNEYVATAVNCISCHETADATWLAAHQQTYGGSCQGCHDGQYQLANFDHNLVYPLYGQHLNATCEACHAGQLFTSTPSTCEGCHQQPDVHTDLFGTDCGRCHTAVAWSPAQLIEHTFALDHGNEGKLPCETCHLDSYASYPCEDCHFFPEMIVVHEAEQITDLTQCLTCHPTGQPGEAAGLAKMPMMPAVPEANDGY